MNSLDIVNTEDEQFKENFPKIMKVLEYKKLHEFEPTIDEITKVYEIISKYIKINKRKVYGGYALNKLLIAKNPTLAIYDETDTPDIEFYSPDPIGDLVKLCDLISKAGFKPVTGQEAQHKETYSIFVNYQLYCDISYMPANIYNKARYLQIDGFNLIHPWFMLVDYFRMFSDPMVSYWRLEKHFARYLKLQKTYPLPLIQKPVEIEFYNNKNYNIIINKLANFIADKDTVVFTGFYVYNYYLYYSNYQKTNKYNYIQMPYLEVYSHNYIRDGLDIIEFTNNLSKELSVKISYIEFYPLFQFYGYNVVFYYNDGKSNIPILYLYSNNKKCIPFKNVDYIEFNNQTLKPELIPNKKINIGSFEFNILHALIILVKVRIDDDNDWNDILYKLINGYVSFRQYYLNEHNKTIYDETIFQGFVLECKGFTISPDRERRLLLENRRKQGKPVIFRYEPETSKHPGNYVFLNSSGNKINNNINLKLNEKNLDVDIDIEDYFENDSVSTISSNNSQKSTKKISKKLNKDDISISSKTSKKTSKKSNKDNNSISSKSSKSSKLSKKIPKVKTSKKRILKNN